MLESGSWGHSVLQTPVLVGFVVRWLLCLGKTLVLSNYCISLTDGKLETIIPELSLNTPL